MENKIEAVVRENVDTTLEQADEFLKQASAATGEEAKELQAKAKECLARASRNMKSFYDKTSEEGREIAGEVNDCVRSNPWRAVGIAAVGGLLLGLLDDRVALVALADEVLQIGRGQVQRVRHVVGSLMTLSLIHI